jgi:hypothetical protein
LVFQKPKFYKKNGRIKMILIDKFERQALDKVGLLKYRKTGRNPQDQNFQVVNKEHCGRNKRTYVAEEPEVMAFLGHYESLNLQKINETQYKQLVTGGLLTPENSQKWRTYVPNAIAYEDKDGQWRIKKVTKLMLFLGIWKNNKVGQSYQKKD